MTYWKSSLALVAALALGACSDPDRSDDVVQVRILSPAPNTVFGAGDDLVPPLDGGLEVEVVAAALIESQNGELVPAPDGVEVSLRVNDGEPVFASSLNGQARFSAFPLVTSTGDSFALNSLVACVANNSGTVCSTPIVVRTDVLPPPCEIIVPESGVVLDAADDADGNLLNGFQLAEAVISTDAGDGTTVLLSVEGNNAGAAVVQGSVARFSNITMTVGDNLLEAQCLDIGGNVGVGSADVTVNVTFPSIEITAPVSNEVITSDAGLAIVAVTAETLFVEPGQVATLEVDGASVTSATVQPGGAVSFPSIALGEGPHTLQAFTQDQTGTQAESLEVDITVDIVDQPPTVVQVVPNCGAGSVTLFAGDDADGDPGNGFQTQILALSTGTRVDLSADLAGGGTFTDSGAVSQGSVFFSAVTLEVGSNAVSLIPVDEGTGLTGAPAICNFIVSDTDFLTIVEPGAGDVIGLNDDVDGNAANGLQVRGRVLASSGVANGTNIEFLVNGVSARTKALNNGQVIFDGADAIPVSTQGNVTLTARAVGASNVDEAQISVVVDTVPAVAVNDLDCDLVNAREGSVTCTFTAPSDPAPGTGAKKYELRLLADAALTDANFNQGQIVAAPNAGTAGSQEVVTFVGARPGATYHVAVVSADGAQNRSLASNDAVVQVNGVPGEVQLSQVIAVSPDAASTSLFGFALDGIGDFNGDGIDDVAIAGLGAGPNATEGEVYVYYGGAVDPAVTFTAPDLIIRGNEGAFLGISVAGVGDFDGDTIDDLAIGASFELAGASSGVVYLFRGRSGAATLTGLRSSNQADLILRNDPTQGLSNFGASLSPAGDLDNDGLADLLIGAQDANGGGGAAYLIYGRDLPAPQTLTLPQGLGAEIEGVGNDRLGVSVAGVGDLNADGFDDIAVGAPQFDANTGDDAGPGYALFFLGGTRPVVLPVGANALTLGDSFAHIDGRNGIDADFGFAVAGVGSLDGDTRPAVAISDPLGAGVQGTVFLFDDVLIGASTPGGADALIEGQGQGSLSFGQSIARGASLAGRPQADLDGDGFADLLAISFDQNALPGLGFLFYGGDSILNTPSRISFSAELVSTPQGGFDALDTVRYIGDINGDGFVDFAVGSSSVNLTAIFF